MKNLVRKSLYYNFDYYNALGEGEFSDDKRTLKFHICKASDFAFHSKVSTNKNTLAHCLDIIRQQLMCNVDIAVLGQVWWNKEAPTALPDFNTKHICRNYDTVRQWAKENQAPEYEPPDYLMPPRSRDDVLEAMP
jgi:hypothetical protein